MFCTVFSPVWRSLNILSICNETILRLKDRKYPSNKIYKDEFDKHIVIVGIMVFECTELVNKKKKSKKYQ